MDLSCIREFWNRNMCRCTLSNSCSSMSLAYSHSLNCNSRYWVWDIRWCRIGSCSRCSRDCNCIDNESACYCSRYSNRFRCLNKGRAYKSQHKCHIFKNKVFKSFGFQPCRYWLLLLSLPSRRANALIRIQWIVTSCAIETRFIRTRVKYLIAVQAGVLQGTNAHVRIQGNHSTCAIV